MLDSQKLLYILPDVTYLAELLPAKKPNTFTIQNFRQINGDFMNEDVFIAENIEKLFGKIDKETYHLILPDFLCTNTIVEVSETNETKVKEYIKEELLPSLTLSSDTHLLKSFVLTEYGGKSKIQLSALEKEIMDPIILSAQKHGVTISGVSPLSWTIKSMISLEPSISVIQMGARAYLAQHYIGIDQTNDSPIDSAEILAETIKTLKGTEPSIQTVYLVTNELIEEKLKENLKEILPLQQLSQNKDDEGEMPSYVKYVIESGARTLSLTDLPVPSFILSKATRTMDEVMATAPKASQDTDDEATSIAELDTTPTQEDDQAEKESAEDTDEKTDALPKPETVPATSTAESTAGMTQTVSAKPISLEDDADTTASEKTAEEEETQTTESTSSETTHSNITDHPKVAVEPPAVSAQIVEPEPATIVSSVTTPLIKNKSGIDSMVKMMLIALATFLATLGIGVALGFGFLSLTQENWSWSGNQTVESTPEPTPESTPEPTPTPTPEPEIDKTQLSILVVNATTKAGYAGKIQTQLEDDEFDKVSAGNAKGEYEPGTYVLMKEKNEALIAALEKATNLTLEFKEDIKTEDPQGTRDAVIVLAE